jgi:ABC-type cobalamin transport system ATPase subunit
VIGDHVSKVLFDLQNVNLHGRVSVLNLQLEKGQHWHFLGPNGAGKSSLMSLLAGIEEPNRGTLSFENTLLSDCSLIQLARTRCFLHLQQHSEFDIPLIQLLSFYTQSSKLPSAINDALNINDMLSKPLSSLSGGQQQRFHIARNLAQIWPAVLAGKGLVLLDEPIAHLDIKYQNRTMQLLQDICDLGNTVIMTSHDINTSVKYASHIGLLHHQQLMFQGVTTEVMSLANLKLVFEHTFTEIDGPTASQKYIV